MELNTAIEIASRYSLFVRQQIQYAPHLLQADDLQPMSRQVMQQRLIAQLLPAQTTEQCMQVLRHFRRWQMVRLAVRDLAGLANTQTTLEETSAMADVLIQAAYHWSYDQQSAKWGTPMGDQRAQQMIVLAMGKLGGEELNFSSDIDLIYVFPEKGYTQGTKQSISNDEFFTKVGQQLTQLLNQCTADGFVFRVDLLLRPFGSAGQLVHGFDALEQYYQVHGRPWERYAMVKARAVTGLAEDIATLESMMRPFVYRRYVDFTMLSSLRELKRMIALEVTKKGSEHDIKLGSGGIREVEFIVQSFQLIYGGQDRQLRGRSLLPMLQILSQRHLLDATVVQELTQAYIFLRAVENRLQMWSDQQTHQLPTDMDRLLNLAQSLNFDDVVSFQQSLAVHRQVVSRHFNAVLGADEPPEMIDDWLTVWQTPQTACLPQPVDDEAQWRQCLIDLHKSRRVVLLSAEARQRLDAVMPLMLAELAEQSAGIAALKRVLPVIKAILNRSAYLVLLQENKVARRQLVQLCAASPWLSNYLLEQPALLDQLLDERQLYEPLSKAWLQEALQQQCRDLTDEESFMELIRRFKHAQVFRVAASDIMGKLPLMKVSDYLTWIAEAIVEQALLFAWQWLVYKHGYPEGIASDRLPLIVVAFGKLGGLELGYSSDLDMVYVASNQLDPHLLTQGKRPIDNTTFVVKLAQKVNSLLTTTVIAGTAYEIDMQLRPHGASGALVPSLAGFFRYEQEQAWIWEHQALIRTRAIAGDPQLMAEFEQARLGFLMQPRDAHTLKVAVLSMRDKMRAHLDKSTEHLFDIKQGVGGIIDIEFMVQYWVLLYAHRAVDIVRFSDNIRQVEALVACQYIESSWGEALMDAYRFYRFLGHQQALAENSSGLVAFCEVDVHRLHVIRLWQQVFVLNEGCVNHH